MWDRFRGNRDGPSTGAVPAFVLTTLLLLTLGCLLGTGYLYLQARQQVDSLSSLAPLRETVVVRADAPTVVRQVQGLSRLETSRYTMEKILDAERSRKYVPGWLAGEKLVFVAHGEVVAGLDLSKITAGDVNLSGGSITLRLPEPEILYSRLDNDKSYVYNRETGVLSKADKDLESQVRATAERRLRDSAVEDGILQEARVNGEKSLRALLTSMGYEDIKFESDEQ